jgi:hypothetical protein
MIPAIMESGIIIYEFIQLLVAFIAVILAMKWKRTEFLPGLAFLFIYAIIDLIDVYYFMIMQGMYIDVAQFGFILLAIIFFIVGMHPSWSKMLRFGGKNDAKTQDKPRENYSVLSDLRKL